SVADAGFAAVGHRTWTDTQSERSHHGPRSGPDFARRTSLVDGPCRDRTCDLGVKSPVGQAAASCGELKPAAASTDRRCNMPQLNAGSEDNSVLAFVLAVVVRRDKSDHRHRWWRRLITATDERHESAISERPGPMPRSWRRASRGPSPGSVAAPSRSVLDPAARCRGRVVRTAPGTYPG